VPAGAMSADPEEHPGYDVARDGLGPHGRRAQWRVGGRAQLPTGDLKARLGARDNRCGRVGAGELVGVDDIAPPLGFGTTVTGIPDRPTNGVAQATEMLRSAC
jgi:hypothetical protein